MGGIVRATLGAIAAVVVTALVAGSALGQKVGGLGGSAAGQKAGRSSQQSAAEVLKHSSAASAELEQLQRNLRSPDAAVRLSTFQAMVASDNPSLKELAIEEGFASTQETMKTLAFRAAGMDIDTISLVPVGLPGGQVYRNHEQYVKQLTFSLKEYDWRSGTFCRFRENNGVCGDLAYTKGQISGRVLTFRSNDCSGQLQNIDGTWEFEGPVTCRYQADGRDMMSGKFRARLR